MMNMIEWHGNREFNLLFWMQRNLKLSSINSFGKKFPSSTWTRASRYQHGGASSYNFGMFNFRTIWAQKSFLVVKNKEIGHAKFTRLMVFNREISVRNFRVKA